MTKRQSAYRPPIAAALQRVEGDPLSAACGTCPMSVWYHSDQLKCFCNMFKTTTWAKSMTPVSICDGREASVARYEQELKAM